MNKNILSEVKEYDHIILYGLGTYGRRAFFDLREYKDRLLFAVTKTSKDQIFYGHRVNSLDYYLRDYSQALVLVAVNGAVRDEMKEIAIGMGFSNVIAPDIQLNDYEYLSGLDPKEYENEIEEWYEVYTGKHIDMRHPRTFDEKIQWLKLYDNVPLKTSLSDKWEVRKYVEERIGGEYLVPTYGIWNSFDEIDFSGLPEKFALKCTHASGTNEIVTSKRDLDIESTKDRFDRWMGKNYAYMCGLELNYKDIVPRIYAEEYLSTEDGVDLRDYKVHVFDGKAKLIQVDIDRAHEHKRNLYSPDWDYIPYSILYPKAPEIIIERPDQLDELVEVSEKLGDGFIYVRCDFYIVNNRILFGEMTFAHGSGVEPFDPDSFDLEMGSWIHLPIEEDR